MQSTVVVAHYLLVVMYKMSGLVILLLILLVFGRSLNLTGILNMRDVAYAVKANSVCITVL